MGHNHCFFYHSWVGADADFDFRHFGIPGAKEGVARLASAGLGQNHLPATSLGAFLFLVCLVLSLFVAAALILPSHDMVKDESLRDYFQMDGRWGLLAVCGFNILAIFANIVFWHSAIISLETGLNLIVCLTPVIAFLGARPA